MSPGWSLTVVVCCNQRSGRACCGGARGEAMRDRVRDHARAMGVRKAMVVHRGSCMGVCGPGVTVAAFGDAAGPRVWSVQPDETDALCAELVRTVMRLRS